MIDLGIELADFGEADEPPENPVRSIRLCDPRWTYTGSSFTISDHDLVPPNWIKRIATGLAGDSVPLPVEPLNRMDPRG
jgi:hypothetical protein